MDGSELAYPDTLVGTDSHTTMINGLGVLGWGVGGIEAEAAMLGQPISMLIPEVIGFKLTGKLPEGVTATDLVLTVTQMLRKKGVVGKFVEFFGPGLDSLPLADRATIANMAPEYGATCGFFPIDAETHRLSHRHRPRRRRASRWSRPMQGARACCATRRRAGVHRHARSSTSPTVRALARRPEAAAGPRRCSATLSRRTSPRRLAERIRKARRRERASASPVEGADYRHRPRRRRDRRHHLLHQHLQPVSVLIAAGLLARKARANGPEGQALGEDLARAGQPGGHRLSRQGRPADTTSTRSASISSAMAAPPASAIPARCPTAISAAVNENDLVAAAVLSGNRNFEGRVNPEVRANYLASPPLVVAYALAGIVHDRSRQRAARQRHRGRAGLSSRTSGRPRRRSQSSSRATSRRRCSATRYADVFKGDAQLAGSRSPAAAPITGTTGSTYVQQPALFRGHDA